VSANPTGGIDVDQSDMQACCDVPKVMEYHQVRTYGWNGKAFVQTAGPTSFTTHTRSIDLKLSAQKVAWGPVIADAYGAAVREATVTLRVTNLGPVTSNPIAIVGDHGLVTPDHALDPLRSGMSRTVTAVVRVDIHSESIQLEVYELGGVEDANLDNNCAVIVNQT
jgi:hypothetical protein